MIGEKILTTIAWITGVGLALLAVLLGSYLVYSVTPEWLRKLALGIALLLMGGSMLGAISKAMVNKGIDANREPRQS